MFLHYDVLWRYKCIWYFTHRQRCHIDSGKSGLSDIITIRLITKERQKKGQKDWNPYFTYKQTDGQS